MSFRHLSALTFLAVLAAGCRSSRAAEHEPVKVPPGEAWIQPSQAKEIDLAAIEKKPVETRVRTSGRITFDEQRVSHVFSPISGRVVTIRAQLGQKVKKGEVLAVIQSPDVGGATSDLAKANAEVTAAEHDFNRKKDLFDQHATSKADLEMSEDNFRKATAERSRALQRTQLLQSGGSLDAVTSTFAVRSPIDGEVIAKNVSPNVEVAGQYAGGTAPELFTVGDTDRVWLLADLYEMDLAKVKSGDSVRVKAISFPDKAFEGKVDWVSTTLDPQTRTARARCSFPNEAHQLRPEMFVSVDVVTGSELAVVLPRSALVRAGDGFMIFLENGTAPDKRIKYERVRVDVDETGGDAQFARVKSELAPDRRVVTRGAILLSGLL